MNTGKRIKQRRIQLGLSVDDLAQRVGKNRATVYRYESSAIEKYDVGTLKPIAEALGVTPAYLMGWEEEKPTFKVSSKTIKFPVIAEVPYSANPNHLFFLKGLFGFMTRKRRR